MVVTVLVMWSSLSMCIINMWTRVIPTNTLCLSSHGKILRKYGLFSNLYNLQFERGTVSPTSGKSIEWLHLRLMTPSCNKLNRFSSLFYKFPCIIEWASLLFPMHKYTVGTTHSQQPSFKDFSTSHTMSSR